MTRYTHKNLQHVSNYKQALLSMYSTCTQKQPVSFIQGTQNMNVIVNFTVSYTITKQDDTITTKVA